MGRRSVNTTKSGKFMNPTDQARKEARKRELKKNKKQRMAVRHAVLKSKDPLQLLEETAFYDKQEYDPSVEAHLNERVLQEKRRKLLETFDRLVLLYKKEDIEYANRLQAARQDYDRKRHEMMLFYEQVKLAERVKADDIPLPKIPQSQLGMITSDIPLPTGNYAKGILKKTLATTGIPAALLAVGRKPPGPPPGPPPELSDSDGEETATLGQARPRKIRFADADAPAGSGAPGGPLLSTPQMDKLPSAGSLPSLVPPSQIPLPPPNALPSFTGLIRPGFPGAPQANQIRFMFQHASGTVLSAPPSLRARDPLDTSDPATVSTAPSTAPATGSTTIEAKPQLKNLIGDATRFVPTALKVRRVTRDPSGRLITTGGGASSLNSSGLVPHAAAFNRLTKSDASASQSVTSKDDAYEQFMREMEGLL